MELNGKIEKVTESFWTNPETQEIVKTLNVLVIEQKDQYPSSIVANVFGTERADQFLKYNKVGDVGKLSFNSRTKESNGRIFNQISYYRFDKIAKVETNQVAPAEEGDLPF